MRFLEKVFVALFIMGLLMKIALWPGNIILLLGDMTLALLYTGLSWFLFRQEDKKLNIPYAILAGIGLGACLVGILFKLLIWEGSGPLLLLGMLALLAAVIIGLIGIRSTAALKQFYRSALYRVIPVLLFGVIIFSMSTLDLIKLFHRDDAEFVRLYTQYYEHPENREYRRQLEKYNLRRAGIPDEAVREYNKAHPSAEDSF